MTNIVLGSSSPYRKALLQKIIPNFSTCSPDIDETPAPGETPEQLVMRLALEKAQAIASTYPDALIITSDQVSVLNGKINGKPNNFENAVKQLKQSSGQCVTFFTSVCVLNSKTGTYNSALDSFRVHFRPLNDTQINAYLTREEPFNCAGSFKSEGLGIALFSKLEGDDPNTLIGLPLIKLIDLLEQQSVKIL